MDRLQSVLNAAARLVHSSRKYDRISPLLRDLHWLRVPERIKFRMAVLVFRYRNQTEPNYLARDLQWADTDDSRRRLRSATTQKLLVRRTRLRTIGDRAFGAYCTARLDRSTRRHRFCTVTGHFQAAALEDSSVWTIVRLTSDLVSCT